MKTIQIGERKIKLRFSLFGIFKYFALIVFAVICLYPVIWIFISSFKTNSELFRNVWGIPQYVVFTNYIQAVVEKRIDIAIANSFIITGATMFVSIVTGAMAAYATTRMLWRFSKVINSLFIVGLMVPTYAALIPLFSMFIRMDLNNTYTAVVLANIAFGLPMTVFILTGFFASLPRELEEAAVIDGCGIFRVFFRIILPISVSPIVTVLVINFLNSWNDLLFPLIFLSSRDMMPLPVILTMFRDELGTNYVSLMAAVVIALVPTVIVYTLLHGRIIEGMTAGAVKG